MLTKQNKKCCDVCLRKFDKSQLEKRFIGFLCSYCLIEDDKRGPIVTLIYEVI